MKLSESVVKKEGSLHSTVEEDVGQDFTQTEYLKAWRGSDEIFDTSGPGKYKYG